MGNMSGILWNMSGIGVGIVWELSGIGVGIV